MSRSRSFIRRLTAAPGFGSIAGDRRAARRAEECAADIGGLDDAELDRQLHEHDPASGTPDARSLALICEAGARSLGQRANREQLTAVAALVRGLAIEMDTGEGKTLAGVLAAVLLVRRGQLVHMLTSNDYLAERDHRFARPLYDRLGITSGVIRSTQGHRERVAAYNYVIVHAPITEIGYDLLRDRMAYSESNRVDPFLDAVIIDEIDSLLVDQAAMPLVLAENRARATEDITDVTRIIAGLTEGRDFLVSNNSTAVSLSEGGIAAVEAALGVENLYTERLAPTLALVHLALQARALVIIDRDYIVLNGSIQIVDGNRGRIAHRQRFSDGLQLAVEIKEGLIPSETGRTLDSLTLHELVAGYQHRSGMSGTLLDVAEDLIEYYGMKSARIEPHQPSKRRDTEDQIYLYGWQQMHALCERIGDLHRQGRPVLVGTRSVAESETIALRLRERGLEPVVLNARNDEHEARVIARAGASGALTVSTQISGRGTDIRLGADNPADRARVIASGGLAIVSTAHLASRRLDMQLRGRAGRRGDPGSTETILCLDDPVLQALLPPQLAGQLELHGEALPRETRLQMVRIAQHISEGQELDLHRNAAAYHRVRSLQRTYVMRTRDRVMHGDTGWMGPANMPAELPHSPETIAASAAFFIGTRLRAIDDTWSGHLELLGELREGIHLRALEGKDPRVEFMRLAHENFQDFDARVDLATRAALAEWVRNGQGRDAPAPAAPTSTFTYLLAEERTGGNIGRFAANLAARIRQHRGHDGA